LVVQGRDTFIVTRQMIRMDQETAQKPMGEIEQFEVVIVQILTEALYRLQASVMQEVQSRAHIDATNLEVGRGIVKMLQITCDQLTSEKVEEKEHVDKLEEGLTMIYDHIPDNAQELDRIAEEKIKIISQTIEGYRQEIKELKEKIYPTTPLEV
jgi:hypothetical protein